MGVNTTWTTFGTPVRRRWSPWTTARRVCLVRQYRHGILDFLWEIPAGKLDPGEPPEVCAVRELAEETGVTARRWTSLGSFLPAPGIFTEIIHLYLAQDLDVGAAAPDADEDLELQWLPLEEAVERVLAGEWNDGKTALALWRAQRRLQVMMCRNFAGFLSNRVDLTLWKAKKVS